MRVIGCINNIRILYSPCSICFFIFFQFFLFRWSEKNAFTFRPFYIVTSPNYLKLIWTIFIQKRHWNPHNTLVITRNICHFTYFYCIIIAIIGILFL